MLTNRQLLILQLTVNDFIESAQPVGSRQLSKKPEAPFSPATIRNDMADLEELGFLEKTHTSSGRVPSEKGYRYYVDHLLQPEKLNLEDSMQLRSIFQNRVLETEELIRNSAVILSELTNYTAILLGPDVTTHSVKRFSIVPLDESKAVAIIVTDSGHVENRVFDVPEGLTASDIEKMVNILNERLTGTPLMHLQRKLASAAKSVLEQHVNKAGELFVSFQKATAIKPEERLFYGGKMNMLKQPEFHDIDKMKMFFELMESGALALAFFQDDTKGIHVRIGSENNLDAMGDCSVITANYSAGENVEGSIAIVGPKRMDYSRVITLLDIVSGDLSKALANLTIGGGSDRRNGQ
ncbi:heat-inducible transcriptional repressor HrcA [Sporosarcina sp. Te-1]|uniref:heat-inducible transcriptional repressor HrcA n=1 Tax=Sporosarcina sp. Te-1 TaxID=2818390 RepID=UPI001A9D943D|nr:heat-inducible transcriptional repressor HrcA [Sporosarcina sp. Te-1]QTD41651.1 heat-inducible transcriptional repressor HrcA [Sporosarcina sp. Te-1]